MKPYSFFVLFISIVLISSKNLKQALKNTKETSRKLESSVQHILLGLDQYKYDKIAKKIRFYLYILHLFVTNEDDDYGNFTFSYTISNSSGVVSDRITAEAYINCTYTNKINTIKNNGTELNGSNPDIEETTFTFIDTTTTGITTITDTIITANTTSNADSDSTKGNTDTDSITTYNTDTSDSFKTDNSDSNLFITDNSDTDSFKTDNTDSDSSKDNTDTDSITTYNTDTRDSFKTDNSDSGLFITDNSDSDLFITDNSDSYSFITDSTTRLRILSREEADKIIRCLQDQEETITLGRYQTEIDVSGIDVDNPVKFSIDKNSIKDNNNNTVIVSPSASDAIENAASADSTLFNLGESGTQYYIDRMKDVVIDDDSRYKYLVLRAANNLDKVYEDDSNQAQLISNDEKLNCKTKNEGDNFYLKCQCKNINYITDNLNNTIVTYPGQNRTLLISLAENYDERTYNGNGIRNRKVSSGLSAGAIVAIIIPSIAVLAAVVSAVYFLAYRKAAKPKSEGRYIVGNNSTTEINQN